MREKKRKMKAISILGLKIKLEDNPKYLAQRESVAAFDFVCNRIVLDSKRPKDMLSADLLHELLHALSARLALNLSERQVASLESGLCAVFAENGWKLPEVKL
jgi:hypothetical protein